jgi:mannose-1-phosphate guanylyltransferase
MQVMILAAGRGTRLGEMGRKLPKALVEIGGRPLLDWQLERLAGQGVQRAVINAHHLGEQIVEFIARRSYPIAVEIVVEPELLGTAGGVRAALDRFEPDAPIVVVNADTLVDVDFDAMLAGHRRSGAIGTICVNWLEDTRGKGLVQVDDEGMITGFVEKPASGPPGLASAGVYALDHKLLELIPQGRFFDLALDLFPRALSAGLPLGVHRLECLAHDIGTPEALAHAQVLNAVNGLTPQEARS